MLSSRNLSCVPHISEIPTKPTLVFIIVPADEHAIFHLSGTMIVEFSQFLHVIYYVDGLHCWQCRPTAELLT